MGESIGRNNVVDWAVKTDIIDTEKRMWEFYVSSH